MKRNRPAKYLEWRLDSDYWARLTPQEAAYLKNFLREFYDSDGAESPERRDILTLTAAQLADLTYPRQRAYYTQEDYMEDPCPRSAATPKTRLLG